MIYPSKALAHLGLDHLHLTLSETPNGKDRHMKKGSPGCLGYIGDSNTQLIIQGIIINHCEDPY